MLNQQIEKLREDEKLYLYELLKQSPLLQILQIEITDLKELQLNTYQLEEESDSRVLQRIAGYRESRKKLIELSESLSNVIKHFEGE